MQFGAEHKGVAVAQTDLNRQSGFAQAQGKQRHGDRLHTLNRCTCREGDGVITFLQSSEKLTIYCIALLVIGDRNIR